MSRWTFLAVPLLLLAACCASGQPRTRILLIGHQPDHPPGTHMYLQVCGLLKHCLEQTRGVEAIVSDGWPKDPEVLKGVSAIVFYTSPGGNILLHPDNRAAAERLLNEGAGLVAIHWATDAQPDLGPTYQSLLGGWFNTSFSKLDVSKARLEKMDPRSPINRGWEEFEHHEEYYCDLRFEPGARPLLKVRLRDVDQVVAWTYERPKGKGRSFGITLGHFYESFKGEAFRRILVNGILWSAGVNVPRNGAPVQADPDAFWRP